MDTIEKFYSKYPEINPEWLLTGRGEMLRGNASVHPPQAMTTTSADNDCEHIRKENQRLKEEILFLKDNKNISKNH